MLIEGRLLINEINANHESKTTDGLSRNVVLIREVCPCTQFARLASCADTLAKA